MTAQIEELFRWPLRVTNHPELDHTKFSRVRPPGEFPLPFTFFSLDFEMDLI